MDDSILHDDLQPTEEVVEEIAAVEDTPAENAETAETPIEDLIADGVITEEISEETYTEEGEAYFADGETVDDDPLAHAFEYQPEPPKKKKWPIILLAILLVIVFVGGVLWATGILKFPTSQKETVLKEEVAMQSENFTVSTKMMSYDMEYWFENFQDYYGSYITYFGLDPTQPLKDQPMPQGEGTWYDYFMNYARKDAEYVLIMNEYAKKNGVTMSEEDRANIDTILAETDLTALKNGVTEKDVRGFWELYFTALAQENAVYDAMNISEDEVEAYYQKNAAAYSVCDYAYYTFTIGEDGDFATTDAASAAVASLTDAKTAQDFQNAVVDYLLKAEEYENREEANKAYLETFAKSGAEYSENDGISDWLFSADTAVGATKTVNNNTSVSVYMLTGAPRRNTEKTVNVRHILLTADKCGSDDAAKQKADDLLAQWQSGAATEESFAELAKQNSEDNAENGGLYEEITKGKTVEGFDDWCFDESRKPGDAAVVQTTYGYHVIYMIGANETWHTNALTDLKNDRYDAVYKDLQAQYPVTANEENIAKIEL